MIAIRRGASLAEHVERRCDQLERLACSPGFIKKWREIWLSHVRAVDVFHPNDIYLAPGEEFLGVVHAVDPDSQHRSHGYV